MTSLYLIASGVVNVLLLGRREQAAVSWWQEPGNQQHPSSPVREGICNPFMMLLKDTSLSWGYVEVIRMTYVTGAQLKIILIQRLRV